MRWRGKRAESRDEGQPFYLWRERYEIDYTVGTLCYATQRPLRHDTDFETAGEAWIISID